MLEREMFNVFDRPWEQFFVVRLSPRGKSITFRIDLRWEQFFVVRLSPRGKSITFRIDLRLEEIHNRRLCPSRCTFPLTMFN